MNVDLNAIFQAGVYLACSGAFLDLAIDISAAIEEVVWNNSKVSKDQLIKLGLTIGKSAVGSHITTLLLAYMAQVVPLMNIINSKAIEAEILHTFVGCIGLELVSSLTSIICGFVLETRTNDERTHISSSVSEIN